MGIADKVFKVKGQRMKSLLDQLSCKGIDISTMWRRSLLVDLFFALWLQVHRRSLISHRRDSMVMV